MNSVFLTISSLLVSLISPNKLTPNLKFFSYWQTEEPKSYWKSSDKKMEFGSGFDILDSNNKKYIKDASKIEYYDVRELYPNCEQDTYDGGNCSPVMSILSTTSLGFRRCMINGKNIKLSPGYALSCQYRTCSLGDPKRSFLYLEQHGTVSKDCFSYEFTRKIKECPKSCSDGSDLIFYKAKSGESVPVEGVDVIKNEILNNGPIAAGFILLDGFQQFMDNYKPGDIYIQHSGRFVYWSGAILYGWGEENGVQYFIAQSINGKDKFDNGFFKIEVKTAAIDAYGFSGIPEIE